MKKKKEIPKNKYIYQRYNGIITKYIVNNEYYIDTQTGIARQKDETAFLGKVAEDIIDLIEVGDIVHIKDVLHQDIVHIWSEDYLKALKEDLNNGIKVVEILTHEQFEQNCYTVERK